jgi:hypothetical protein
MPPEPIVESRCGPAVKDVAPTPESLIRLRYLPALGAVTASAALLFLGTGLHPVWWLTWLGVLPVLLVAPRLGAWPAFAVAGLAWLAGSLNMWPCVRDVVQVPFGITVVFLLLPAGVFGLVVVLFRAYVRCGVLWRAALAFPTGWVAYEFLLSVSSPHGTYPNLGFGTVVARSALVLPEQQEQEQLLSEAADRP